MSKRDAVVAEGRKWIGKLYYSQEVRYDFRDGGSADCSSFYEHCMRVGANYDPGDWTVPQYANGKSISRSQLLPGDAVFYGMNGGMRHVVLYIGDGLCLSQGGPGKGPVICNIDYRGDISGYRTYSALEPGPAPTPPGPKPSDADYQFGVAQVRKGSKGNYVKLAQRMLKDMGYYSGNIDGDAGDGTIEAIKKFQRARGITVDGGGGQQFWSALTCLAHNEWKYIIRHVFQGCTNTDSVKMVQRLLNSYGCRDYDGKKLDPDGSFGYKTAYAVRVFQRSHNLKVDADVGKATLKALIGY